MSPAEFCVYTLTNSLFYVIDSTPTTFGNVTWTQLKSGPVSLTYTLNGVDYPCQLSVNWEATTLATSNDIVKLYKPNNLGSNPNTPASNDNLLIVSSNAQTGVLV